VPVDPSILFKYHRPAKDPGPPREGWLPLIVAATGTPVLLGFAWLADGAPVLIQGLFVATVIAWLLAMARLVYIGYQEDGILGALFQRKHPLGSEFSGERPASWLRFSVGWLLVLASVLCGMLIVRTPGAIPESWLHRQRMGTSARDQLLK
jgi:hypothetical protein